jgi:hypothetical protein
VAAKSTSKGVIVCGKGAVRHDCFLSKVEHDRSGVVIVEAHVFLLSFDNGNSINSGPAAQFDFIMSVWVQVQRKCEVLELLISMFKATHAVPRQDLNVTSRPTLLRRFESVRVCL